ncbi:MAG: hypothetical protein AB2L09_10150 [Coriobacteriia bacterium]
MPSKKWIFFVNFWLSLIMCAILSVCLTIGQGDPAHPLAPGSHLSLSGFAVTFCVAFISSMIVATFVPLVRIGAWMTRRMNGEPGTHLWWLIDSAIQVTFFLVFVDLLVTLGLTGINVGFAGLSLAAVNPVTGLNWFDLWWVLNMKFWPVAYVAFLVARPSAEALATKSAGGMFAEAPASQNA